MYRASKNIGGGHEKCAPDDKWFAWQHIAQPSGQRGREHVSDEKVEGERSDGGIGDVELTLDALLHTRQDVAV